MYDIHEYLEPINKDQINNDEGFFHDQFGFEIQIHEDEMPDLELAEIVILGITEQRGAGLRSGDNECNAIRRALYNLYLWHADIHIADLGNIKTGESVADSYAAIRIVVSELIRQDKTVILIGGSHDVTLAQYASYKELKTMIEATVIDSSIDLQMESVMPNQNFLMEMLTSEPNHISHYSHIGFQSYFVHPKMLETLDKLRFDCFRVGVAKEDIEEMEPVIRNSSLVSFDISAIKHSDAPSNVSSPNGFSGEEACMLTRFAGMSEKVSSLGIFGYVADRDINNMTSTQIAQMIWYFIDGKSRIRSESSTKEKVNFNEYHVSFTDIEFAFLQSKKTGRWWMELPNKKLVPCSKKDYLDASNNLIPERWLRAQERG